MIKRIYLLAGASPPVEPGETGTPRFATYFLRQPQVSQDFNINGMVPALPDLALAPSNMPHSLSLVPAANIFCDDARLLVS